MKRMYYTLKEVGFQPFSLSILLSGLVTLVILSDTVVTEPTARFQVATKYLAWGTAFLSTVLMAYSFRPEDSTHVETQASLPTHLYQIVGGKILACSFMIILPTIGALVLIANITHQASAVFLGHGLIIIIVNAFFFGSVTTLGTVLGRKSIVGTLIGLILVVIFSLLPLPEIAHPFLQNIGSVPFSASLMTLIVYIIVGAIMFITSLSVLKDIDYLLAGKETLLVLPHKNKTGNTSHRVKRVIDMSLEIALSTPGHTITKGVAYELLQWMINGWLPIMMGAVTIVFSLPFSRVNTLYTIAIDFPRSIIMFSLILLPPILCDSISSDKRSHRTEIILAYVSSQTYLSIKVVSVWIAVLGTVIIGSTLSYVVLSMYALSGLPQYLVANIAIFLLAVAPFLVYISSLSILVGSLANQRPAFVIGGIISLIAVISYALTANNIVGNLFFPSGTMAIETVGEWLRQQVGVRVTYLEPPETIVPWYLLPVPLVVLSGQIALAWQLALHSLERKKG